MRYPVGAVRAVASAFWWWLVSTVRCDSQSDTVMENIVRNVMANDINWAPVLMTRIKLDENQVKGNAAVERLLKEVGLENEKMIDALPLIKRLAKSRSFTGSELKFGVDVLGCALSCKLSSTVVLHTFFAHALSKREYADVPMIRSTMSKIQEAVAMYADKVAAFDQPVSFFRQYNDAMNVLFAKFSVDANLPLTEFTGVLGDLVEMGRQVLRNRCEAMNEQKIATTHRATGYNDSLFQDIEEVDEHELLTVIEDMEPYDYVDIVSGGYEFWKNTFRINSYRVQGNTSVTDEKDTNDES